MRGAPGTAAAMAALLCGCATMSGRSQRVALDSTPRGVAVRDADAPDEPPLGHTPVVVDLSRDPSKSLVFETPLAQAVPVECHFRWRVVGLGNTPFLLLSLSVFGAGYVIGVGVDLLTGAAWDCPLRITPPDPVAGPPGGRRRILVLPPAHDDTGVQDALAVAWQAAMRDQLSPGDEIRLPAEYRTLLTRLGDPRRPKGLNRQRLNTLLQQTRATHLAVLKWEPVAGGTRFTADLFDAYRETTEPAPPVTGPSVDTGDGGLSWGTLFEYLHFIPNSVAWLPGFSEFNPEVREQGASLASDPHASLPGWLSGFTLTSAEHPDAFDAWDLHGKIEPSLGLTFIDSDVRVTGRPDGAPALDDRFTAGLVRLYYELGGTAHTPVGAFDAGVLAGYALAFQDRWAGSASHVRGRVELGLGLRWTAFLSERLYFRFGAQAFVPVRPLLETDAFRSAGIGVVWAGLGLYLPETRWWLRSLF